MSRSRIIGTALGLAMVLAITVGFVGMQGQGTAAEAAGSPGTRVSVGGGDWFLHGANVAWYNWACDFGCGSNGGVSSPGAKAAIGAKFAELKAAGMKNVRWWMFEGDAWQITRDGSGAPTGIDSRVYTDLDAALELAEQYDIYLTLVIFNFPGDIPSGWLNNAGQRAALANVLAPMFARYANNPRVFAWEPFNEPEWDIWSNKVDVTNTQATVRAIVDAVKANSPAYTTVGSAMIDGVPLWQGMGLDFYQAHWYDYMNSGNWCASCTTYDSIRSRYSLDAPLVIGEIYLGSDANALNRIEDFYARGYAGIWGWSLFPEKTSDRMAIDMNAMRQFAANHTSAIGPGGSGGSTTAKTATATKTATPSATEEPTATPTSSRRSRTSGGSTAPTVTATAATPAATATATPETRSSTRRGRTSTSTTPVATATSTPVSSGPAITAWGSSATVSSVAYRGSTVTVTAKFQSPNSASNVIVDVELFGPNGEKMYQKYYSGESFTAGEIRTFTVTYNVPGSAATGTWSARVGAFTSSWSLLHWQHNAAFFEVR